MNRDILISFIISTRGKPWTVLSKTLDSIYASGFSGLEVILVDQNGESGFGPEIKSDEKYSGIIYLPSEERGLSKGRNLGIRHAKGSWLIFFDDDAILPPDTLGKAEAALRRDRESMDVFYGSVLTLETGRPYLKKAAVMGKRINLFNFDSVCSVSLIFSRRAVKSIGGFDEGLGAGCELGAGEETDILIRALAKGIEIRALRDFVVYHPEAKGSIDLAKRRSYGMGLGAVYRKHIFSSPYFFLALGVKLLSEMMLRLILILVNLLQPSMRRYHASYLMGFLKGFFTRGLMIRGSRR